MSEGDSGEVSASTMAGDEHDLGGKDVESRPEDSRNRSWDEGTFANDWNHFVPAKRLFSGTGSNGNSNSVSLEGMPVSAPGTSSATANHRVSATSDCGSEFTRSLDDITMSNLARLDLKSEGCIRLNIPVLSALKSKVNTSYHYIGNLPWRLAAKTECSKRTSHLKFFSVYIDCNPESESMLWSCDALVDFRLLAQKSDCQPFSRHVPSILTVRVGRNTLISSLLQFTNKFNYNSNNWGFPSFIEWTEILSPDKGLIRGDRVVVEARITVQKVVGVRNYPRFNFLSAQPNTSDAILVINGVRLHVSKQYLSLYSPVFNAMFFSKFLERDKQEIPMEDVILEEFIELLQVMYPSHKPVSAENVEFLLDLGDKFEIEFVINECERFLMSTDDIPVATKLVWADQYQLAKLEDVCIRTLKSVNDVKSLKQTEEYKNFSNSTKAALLEKLFRLLKD